MFCMILGTVYIKISDVICHSNEQRSWIHEFRAKDALHLKPNSIDIIAIGTSPNISGFSPMELYKMYGISSFSAGVGFISGFFPDYLLIQEMLKTQHPSIVLIEVHSFFGENTKHVGTRVVSDAIGFSVDQQKALNGLPEGYLMDSRLSYLLPILKYHTRYQSITKDDFFKEVKRDYYDYFLGFKALHEIMGVNSEDFPIIYSTDDVQRDPFQEKYLSKIINLCQERGITPILYKSPINNRGHWSSAEYRIVKEYAEQNNLEYIDFNLKELAQKVELDLYKDFNDNNHLNFYGAAKISQYLGQYLHKNYDLPDHRGDPEYSYLDTELIRYEREKMNEEFLHIKSFNEYLDLIREYDKQYTVIFSICDEAVKNLNGDLRKQLNTLGFTDDFDSSADFQHSFIGILQDGKVIYEAMSDGNSDIERDALTYHGVLPNGLKYYVSSAGYQVGNASSIVIDGVEYSVNKRGFNIVIYDNQNERVVDSICFDTWKDAGLTFSR